MGKPGSKWRAQQSSSRKRNYANGSSINTGDTGIFVTCDKGNEKRSLDELENLLTEYLGLDNSGQQSRTQIDDASASQDKIPESAQSPEPIKDLDIENDILAELAEIRDARSNKHKNTTSFNASSPSTGHKNLSLITLDIPCVSFVRFPPHSARDAVEIVHQICTDAAVSPDRPRSRFIKRLTPVTLVRKVMSNGIDELCNEVLLSHFGSEQEAQTLKYAIRPTIRNNNQVDRDKLIKSIADRVSALGEHKVDLTGYDKLILVDIYRNICGMSVVGSDYEALKRYNLAEIYAAGRKLNEASIAEPPTVA